MMMMMMMMMMIITIIIIILVLYTSPDQDHISIQIGSSLPASFISCRRIKKESHAPR